MLQTIVRVCQIAFLVLGTVALGWYLFEKFGGDRRIPLDAYRRILAERAVERLVDEIPRRDAVKRLLVMPVRGDVEGHIHEMLIERLEERPDYITVDAKRYEAVVAPENAAQAIVAARKLASEARPDGVLFTQALLDYGRKGVGARVDVESHLVVLDPEAKFATDKARATEEITSRASLDWFEATMEETSAFGRLAFWALLTAGLPFALFPVVQSVTRKEDNRLNALLLGGLTGANVLFALALLGIRPGVFGAFLMLVGGLAGFVYNFVICDRIDEMRE